MIYKTLKKVSEYCQLFKPNFLGNQTTAGVTCTSNGNTFTLNGTSSGETYISVPIYYITSKGAGHKFLISGCPQGAWSSYSIYFGALNQETNARDYGNGAIFTSTTAAGNYVGVSIEKADITFDNLVFKPQLFDLTEMYGAGHEPTTVEEFRQDFPEEMYDYKPYCFVTSYKDCLKVSNVCQLLDKSKYRATQTVDGVTFTNNGDGTITVNSLGITATTHYMLCSPITLTKGHKYTAHIFGSYTDGYFYISVYNAAGNWVSEINQNIVKVSEDGFTARPRIAAYINKPTGDKIYKPQLFDLTEMYGAGHEPTTVEQFRADFPDELYDYKPYSIVPSYKKSLMCKTKNLFDIPLTRGYPSDTSYEDITLRTFTVGTYIIGMTRNNQYAPYYVANVTVSKNSILFKTEQSGYGVSVPFLLTVDKTYTVSCKADNNFYPAIGISYYKEDGTFISFTQSEVITNNPVKSFTVPENTYYTLILFYGRTDNEYTFSNIQLEEGSTATEYHPYGYL